MGEIYLPLLIYALRCSGGPHLALTRRILSRSQTSTNRKSTCLTKAVFRHRPSTVVFRSASIMSRCSLSSLTSRRRHFIPGRSLLKEFKKAGLGAYALVAMASMWRCLGIGYAYEWKKGGLSWK